MAHRPHRSDQEEAEAEGVLPHREEEAAAVGVLPHQEEVEAAVEVVVVRLVLW